VKLSGLLARSAAMCELFEEVRRYAQADATVLVTGETGTGKDAVAHALHTVGPRRHQPYVKIDCPSLPHTLVESELFGHERGAFTDAASARAGRFEIAGRGTVYLDNVNELAIDAQAKLLRLVEEKHAERLGGTVSYPLQARVIASADAHLEAAVRDGAFREDLYHRLRVLPLRLPPLRDHRGDIPPLARAFLRESGARQGRARLRLSNDAISALERYAWPGNVRELKHAIERTVLSLEPGRDEVRAMDLPPELFEDVAHLYAPDATGLPTLDEVERRYIEQTLRQTKDNQGEAAKILGISRKALWEKRKRYGLR
jgi:DNA-binding NtrC family response regulator